MLIALTSAIFGALPIAVLVAAFAIPVVYIVYLYDVNLWKDAPVPVTGLAFGLTAMVGAIWTAIALGLRGTGVATLGGGPTLWGFVVIAIVTPLVGELIRQVGPVLLARMPRFDDLMDGLTFGVISGVAYATADTLVKHWPLIVNGFQGLTVDAPTWAALLFLEGFVKPLVLGTATGIACAEFSGLGRGYDGFTPRYYRAVVEAVLYNVFYFGVVYLLSFIGNPLLALALSIVLGLAVLAVLIVRVRNVLHHGLMEAALESSARETIGDTGELEFCQRCEMPLQPAASFCSACGTAVLAVTPPTDAGHQQPGMPGEQPSSLSELFDGQEDRS